jgi:hypothetical protein
VVDGPTDAQQANGDYVRSSVPSPSGGNRVAQVYINRGGTPVARWHHAGKLDDRQLAVIQWCQRLWSITGQHQRLTAQYGERTMPSHSVELQAIKVLAANEDLDRIKGYFTGLDAWWNVFENVCRFDQPAGFAGAALGYGSRSAEDRAHTTVCFVADIIATKERM